MSKASKLLLDGAVFVFGWLICFSVLGVAYGCGILVASWLGWGLHAEMTGLLSAIATIWLYEHQNIHEKYDALQRMLARNG